MSNTSSDPGVGHQRVGAFRTVELTGLLNCVGIQTAARLGSVAFNIWGNGFPAEELPAAGPVVVDGVPFQFPANGRGIPDNMRCRGQLLPLTVDRVDWLYLLGAAERRTEDPLLVHYRDGATRRQWLRVSDFWPETPARFGETLAYRTSSMLYPRHVQLGMAPGIWLQRVAVSAPRGMRAIEFPENPALHIFALTLLDEEAGGT